MTPDLKELAAVKADRDDWKARAEAAEADLARVRAHERRIERRVYKNSAEYKAYLDARFSKAGLSFEFDGHRWAYQWTHFDDSGDYDLLYRNEPQAQPAAQEPTSAVPVVGQLVEALSRNRIMASDSDGSYTIEVTPRIITDAIAAGQQYLKENGK